MNKKKLSLWSLYNFGGAIVEVVFIFYFSQWLVIDQGVPDIWYNATLIASSIILLLCAPIASAWGDGTGKRLPGLRFGAVLAAVCFAAVGLIATEAPTHTLLAAAMFTLGLSFFLFAGVFWNALLPDLASSEKFGLASGWGQAGDWAGEIFGLIVTLPFVGGALFLFGAHGRAQAFVPAALLFLLFTLPMLFWYRENSGKNVSTFDLRLEYRNALNYFIELCSTRGLGWFYLSFFLFNDAIITAANNFPIYLQRVFGVSDVVKSMLVIGILASGAVGALVSGWVVDRIGFRKALLWNLGGWMIILPFMAITSNFILFAAETVIMGLWFGSVWVIAHTLIAHLAPPQLISRAFSYYTLMERFATLVGPLSWGLIIALVPSNGSLNYHIALLCMTVFVVIGFFLARKIPAGAAAPSLVS